MFETRSQVGCRDCQLGLHIDCEPANASVFYKERSIVFVLELFGMTIASDASTNHVNSVMNLVRNGRCEMQIDRLLLKLHERIVPSHIQRGHHDDHNKWFYRDYVLR